ncbi:phage tail tube protein [Paracoccus tibetensis]|uniref:Phage tail tube protein n=1 Tax=Paracoccus tibetensis TaxID=336292 RepID=A0A1G5HCQ1_9RHOB|nr:phage tail tube protein [Paracoccus tibetensis]SCY61546.1 hypothetical protein SAMN05660710_02108 [Paracoccus tibetensis]
MTGRIGYGSTVRIGRLGTNGAPAFIKLDLVGDLEAPDEQVDEVETTHMESPGRRKQFIAGLIDSGELTVPMNYVPRSATHALLTEIKATGEEVLIELTLGVDGEPETFTGFAKGYRRTAPIAGKMTAEAVFRLNSQVESEGAGE